MISLAVNLAAAVALLLWSVRLIRTGVERAFMPDLRRWLRESSRRPLTAATGGVFAAMFLQSATAVALISSGFANSGLLALSAALAIILGAELGSALMTQVLLLPIHAVVPFALLLGVVTFFNARDRKTKQFGRIVIGFALVLVSIEMIRAATAPVGGSDILQAITAYLEQDLLSALIIGALLAWAMHSSLAAILTLATFAAAGLVTADVAAAMVIGANLGGALIPVVLLWSAPRPARVVVFSNLLARGLLASMFFVLLLGGVLDTSRLAADPGQQAILLHVLLNLVLLVSALPFCKALTAFVDRITPVDVQDVDDHFTALDPAALEHPQLALACAQRELLRMAETLHMMLTTIMHPMRKWDADTVRLIEQREEMIDRMHYETKIYLTQSQGSEMTQAQARRAVELVTMANNLEEAADRIAVNLLTLARKLHSQGLTFSRQGQKDLEHLHDHVVMNMQLALGVLTTGDAEAARQLVVEKDRIRREEQRLQEKHLQRLKDGDTDSIETTNIHQETLRQLKQINAAISYVAYPIAEEAGDLLDSRLARPKLAGSST